MSAAETFDIFAITAPGLESVCAAELRALGLADAADRELHEDEGGVSWSGGARSLYRANLECRTASRIVVRAGTFRARTFAELERHAARIDWSRFMHDGLAVSLRVTCRKSKLYHAGAVAERIERVLTGAVDARVQGGVGGDDGDEGDAPAASTGSAAPAGRPAAGASGPAASPASAAAQAGEPSEAVDAQVLVVRFMRDVCTISIDASGARLHQRGYRQALARAPVRETLAAAMLLAAGYDGTAPLIDPMCGSGTIPIEAALLARRIAPGLANERLEPRRYAFERWPGYDATLWRDVVEAARVHVRPAAPATVRGTDRDAGAITAATANAARAGVAADAVFRRATITELDAPAGTGHLVTNAPYGVRVGDARTLQPLYAALGRVARERLAGWQVAMLAASPRLAQATGLRFEERFATRNGGIAVNLLHTHIADRAG